MAWVRLMYWKEIPVQVQAVDGPEQISQPLDDRFQQGADAISMFDGSAGTDEYLMAWNWSEQFEVEGTVKEAADQTAARYNSGFPTDFVARIRDLHNAGEREPTPGAIDNWMNGG
ncbi:MAG: virulence factor [Chloroflexi bacterium]|nr:virulence factor [Chloroflexota bacterium]